MLRLGFRKNLLPLALLALALPVRLSCEQPAPVRASLVPDSASIAPGEAFSLDLVLDIDPGWHVYGPSPAGTGLPTTVSWELPPGYSALPLEWPAAERFSLLGVESEGYSGELLLHARFLAPASIPDGRPARIAAKVEWLACKVECMPGQASLELYLPVSAGSGPGKGLAGLGLALALALAGGLILNLMPCVLPVLSLKALSLAKLGDGRGTARGGADRGGSLAAGLYFTAGVLVSFWLFAGILLAARAAGSAAGWGFQLQEPAFVAAAAMLFFLMALNLFGVFEVGVSLTRLGPGRRARGGAAASFFGGAFAAAVATPCTAPFMGVAVGYALSHDAASALAVFTALGLGMASPMLAIAAFPVLARRLPKAGAWTLRFRQFLGFPMAAAALWMASVLAGSRGAPALVALLGGFLAAGAGAWAWGTWGGMDRPRRTRIAAALVALALLAGGLAWTMRGLSAPATAPSAASAPLPGAPRGVSSTESEASFWRPWSEAALAELRREGRPVFVDFTAAWCLSCQVNEAVALGSPALRARFAELGVVAMKADWTAKDEAIGRALGALGRASVPVYALYAPGASAPVLLPEILTPAIVLRYLNESIVVRTLLK